MWCQKMELGLPKPDIVFYLNVSAHTFAKRHKDNYKDMCHTMGENCDYYTNEMDNHYKSLMDDTWISVDCNRPLGDVSRFVLDSVIQAVSTKKWKLNDIVYSTDVKF